MNTQDRVWTLLIEANPVPSVDVYATSETDVTAALTELEERSSAMTQTKKRTGQVESRRGPAIRWMAGAAVAVLAGAIFLTTWQGTPQPEVAAVMDAIDVFNSGDGEAWREAFDPSAEEVSEPWAFDGGLYYTHDVMMAANEQLTVIEPCEVTGTDPTVVECVIAEVNDWHGKAGITHDVVTEFELNDEMLITSWNFGYGCCEDEFAFNRAFWFWLSVAHADVAPLIRPVDGESFPGFERDPEHMAVAIQYVDEFLAQSDEYPVDNHTRVIGDEG